MKATELNKKVDENLAKLQPRVFYLPILLLFALFLYLFCTNSLSAEGYIQIQKKLFYKLNATLSQFPLWETNLTQIGDALVFLSLLTALIVYAPKIWEALINALLVSAVFTNVLKKFFAIMRPAAVFDNDSFTILGKVLKGANSLPSGHSITTFTILTVLLFALMPKKFSKKVLWSILVLAIGLAVASSRVGVGAHYPLDVVFGSIIGYVSGLFGIFINQKISVWKWVHNKKSYPFFMLLFIVVAGILVQKIIQQNLFVYSLALLSLIVSLYIIINKYVQK